MDLLTVYQQMTAAANEEVEKTAAATAATEQEEQVVDAQMQKIAEYAAYADELLAEEFGDDYEAEDVEKLAEMLIKHEDETAEKMEKVAEAWQTGVIMADGFIARMIEAQKNQ